jgi:hypothetical protein
MDMERKVTHLRRAGATFVLLLALVGAAPAYAGSAGGAVRSDRAGSSTSVQSTVIRDHAIVPGWGWSDGALWIGALLGVVALGLWGDIVIGAAILGIAAVGDAVALVLRRLVARRGPQAAHSRDAPQVEPAQPLQR